MSFIKIDICKAGAFRPNVCGRRGKRSCKQQRRQEEKASSDAAARCCAAASSGLLLQGVDRRSSFAVVAFALFYVYVNFINK